MLRRNPIDEFRGVVHNAWPIDASPRACAGDRGSPWQLISITRKAELQGRYSPTVGRRPVWERRGRDTALNLSTCPTR
jgi:hypothetical protein